MHINKQLTSQKKTENHLEIRYRYYCIKIEHTHTFLTKISQMVVITVVILNRI